MYCFRPIVPPTSSKSRCKTIYPKKKNYDTSHKSHKSREKEIPCSAWGSNKNSYLYQIIPSPQESNGPPIRKFESLICMQGPFSDGTDRKRDLTRCQG